MGNGKVHWEVFRTPAGKGWVVLLEPRAHARFGALLRFEALARFDNVEVVLAGSRGNCIRVPLLANQFLFWPPGDLWARVMVRLHLNTGAVPALFVRYSHLETESRIQSDPTRWNERFEIRLGEAWNRIPDELEGISWEDSESESEELERAYRADVVQMYWKFREHPQVSSVFEAPENKGLVTPIPKSWRPLNWLPEVSLLSQLAEAGKLAEFREHFLSLPPELQLNSDIKKLCTWAEHRYRDPEAADAERSANAQQALAAGRFQEALDWLSGMTETEGTRSHTLRLRAEATIGLCWGLLEKGLRDEANRLFAGNCVVDILSEGHPGVVAVREEMDRQSIENGGL